jgi:hypothetical protein
MQLAKLRGKWPVIYAAALAAYGICLLAARPIALYDADLWYHLAGGRFILAHGALPRDSSYFSFITPPRPYSDYFWLFQALVYGLFARFGYGGLLALRSLAYAAAAGLTAGWIFRKETPAKAAPAYLAALFALACLSFDYRFGNVRPQMFTYLGMAFFIYVLEARPRLAWLLPPAAVLWVNGHGVTYPVAQLIAGAYVAEYFFLRLRGRAFDRSATVSYLAPLGLATAAAFVTPLGWKLVDLPFESIDSASKLGINELHQFSASELSTLVVDRGALALSSFFGLVLACGAVSVLIGLRDRRLRVSHAVLWLGAAALATRGARFVCELTLLSLPVLAAHPLWTGEARRAGSRETIAGWALAAALAVIPFVQANNDILRGSSYPFSSTGLPVGVSDYLNRAAVGGGVLADPMMSGYLEWSLAPGYRTYCDMQVFIFNYFDVTSSYDAFRSDSGLRRVLDRYKPRFVLAPLDRAMGDRMRLRPEYVPLTFDDTGVLFGRASEIPKLAAHRLRSLDPFAPILSDDWPDQVKDPESALKEVKVVAASSKGGYPLDLAVQLELKMDRNKEAEADARALVARLPDAPRPELLLGDALMALSRPGDAVAAYKRAMELSADLDRQKAELKLGRAFIRLGRWKEAYDALTDAVIVWNREPSAKDISDLLRAAVWAGHVNRAKEIMEFAELYLGEDLRSPAKKARFPARRRVATTEAGS